MNTVPIHVPDSLYQQMLELTKKENITPEQFVLSAVSEKMSAFLTRDYLQQRAQRASKEKFQQAMNKISNVEPEEHDRL